MMLMMMMMVIGDVFFVESEGFLFGCFFIVCVSFTVDAVIFDFKRLLVAMVLLLLLLLVLLVLGRRLEVSGKKKKVD